MNAAETLLLPYRFSASIGGYMGSSYSVELLEHTLTFSATVLHYESPEHTHIRPTDAQWRAFRHALNDVNVWQWLSDYPNPGVCDGTFWSLDIAYADCALTTQGENNYPDANGKPNDQPAPTKSFNRFLRAISRLTGRNFE